MAVALVGGILYVQEEASRAGGLKDEFSIEADSAIVIKGEALSCGPRTVTAGSLRG